MTFGLIDVYRHSSGTSVNISDYTVTHPRRIVCCLATAMRTANLTTNNPSKSSLRYAKMGESVVTRKGARVCIWWHWRSLCVGDMESVWVWARCDIDVKKNLPFPLPFMKRENVKIKIMMQPCGLFVCYTSRLYRFLLPGFGHYLKTSCVEIFPYDSCNRTSLLAHSLSLSNRMMGPICRFCLG